MESVSEYLLTVTAAAIICATIKQLPLKNGPLEKSIPVMTGIFLCITLISPLIKHPFTDVKQYLFDFNATASESVDYGTEAAMEAKGEIIKQKSQAYILDEAMRLGLNLSVEVKLNGADPPVPVEAILCGEISPYKRSSLSQYIANHLGISQENQQWN